MKTNNWSKKVGKRGEAIALSFLLDKGFVLLEQNYRHKRSEIDLIMRNDQTVVFIEVKHRNSIAYGYPEEFVSGNQKRSIIEGAEHYVQINNWEGNIRFDIVAVIADSEISHFEDAFY